MPPRKTCKKASTWQLYKAQINPHFLFNTLNTLYGLMISGSEKAEPAFVKFTELLRYMYSNSTQDKTSVDEEINYISEYIDLQLLRLNEHTNVCFTHQEDDTTLEIAPMILITFIENVFKDARPVVSPNHACDRFMAMVGGWTDVGAYLRWPYRSIPLDRIESTREQVKNIIPEFFIPPHKPAVYP